MTEPDPPHVPRHHARLADLQALVGQCVGTTPWALVDQARIDAFARCTGDLQWIHTDPVRAASGPFGATVARLSSSTDRSTAPARSASGRRRAFPA